MVVVLATFVAVVVVEVVVDVVVEVVVVVVVVMVDNVAVVVVFLVVDIILVIFVVAGRDEDVEVFLILFFNLSRLMATGLFELTNFVSDTPSDVGTSELSPSSCKLYVTFV